MSAATRYSYAQLEQLWINNGGSPALAPVAAAIAEAESGGNPQAENTKDNNGTQTSWGLWQISDGTHSQPVPGILDPNTNAAQAVAKYQAAGGWSPWGTYSSGAYTAYLSPGTTPDANVPVATLTAATAPASGTKCLIAIPHTSQCIVSKEGVRLVLGGVLMGAGGLLVLIGLVVVASGSSAGQAVINATPVGRGAKALTRGVKAPGKPANPKPGADA
jgi:Lysozyme like domain